ncbi:MAG: hypothetical protein HY906_04790 [Deltaproteobacteria bacterium]|nr:hypothetical protein [Deltaproteobacteria bacterium]
MSGSLQLATVARLTARGATAVVSPAPGSLALDRALAEVVRRLAASRAT